MSRKVSVTPGSITVMGARIGALVAALFLIFGDTFGYVVLQEMPGGDPGPRILTIMFFVIWTVACASILVLYLRIGFGKGSAAGNSLVDLEIVDSRDGRDRKPPRS